MECFKHFHLNNPTDVRYIVGYIDSLISEGVYDLSDIKHCETFIEQGLCLPNKGSSHKKLNSFQQQLISIKTELTFENGSQEISIVEPSGFHKQFKEKRYREILNLLEIKRRDFTPKGIIGGQEDLDFWVLFQTGIKSYFAMGKFKDAIALLNEYETERIEKGLTPIPNLALQETVIGCLLQIDKKSAQKKVQFWFDNSKMPTISDLIKNHSSLREICSHLSNN